MEKSFGKIVYNPSTGKTRIDPWWMIVSCGVGIVKYYQNLIINSQTIEDSSKRVFSAKEDWVVKRKFKMTESAWGAHISSIRGEEPLNKQFWNKYNNKTIEFFYNPEQLQSNGYNWCIPVESEKLQEIRVELGLMNFPTIPFHLTIGAVIRG